MLFFYDLGITQKNELKVYQRLMSMCRTHLESKRREKVQSDLKGRSQSRRPGAVGKGGGKSKKTNGSSVDNKADQGECRSL